MLKLSSFKEHCDKPKVGYFVLNTPVATMALMGYAVFDHDQKLFQGIVDMPKL